MCRFLSGVGFCVRSIQDCPTDNPVPEEVELVAIATWCRSGAAECHLVSHYDVALDELRVSTRDFYHDGGVSTHDGGLQRDAGLAGFWSAANGWCLNTQAFSVADDCLTHDFGIRVRIARGAEIRQFDYYRGSGLLPPLGVETAVEMMLRVSEDSAFRGGVW